VGLAAPVELSWQTRLLDAAGAPRSAPIALTVELHAAADGSSPVWSDVFAVTPEDGFVTVALGSGAPLDLDALAVDALWVRPLVDGSPLGSPQPLRPVPSALFARAVARADAPAPPCEAGELRWDTATDTLRVCDGAAWRSVGGDPPGAIVAYGGVTEPEGWLFCDGRAVSRATYAELFAAIGTRFGAGDGSSTFNLPDLRGRFPRGWDAMGGTAAGRDPGRALGSAQDDLLESHAHGHTLSITASGTHDHSASAGHSTNHNDFLAGSTAAYGLDSSYTSSRSEVYGNFVSDESHTHPNSSFAGSISATGGAETRPVNLAVGYLIRH
jgi:microcystin-dependent protein